MSKVIICLTIDWEGEHFRNLNDLKELRRIIGEEIPVTHFICPAYFTNRLNRAKQKIKSIIKTHDEVGLHIHCYKSLIENIKGINFIDKPNYYNENSLFDIITFPLLKRFLRLRVSGRGVPLSAYTYNDIEKIVRYSKELLAKELNLQRINSFRAGGWIASDDVLECIEKNGFLYDSSAVPPEILSQGYGSGHEGNRRDDYGDYNGLFTELILKLWGNKENKNRIVKNSFHIKSNKGKEIKKETQPYYIGKLFELPNNCALSDFSSAKKTMRPALGKAFEKDTVRFLCIGCHQEGDFTHKLGLIEFMKSINSSEKEKIEFTTIEKAGELFKNKFQTISFPIRSKKIFSANEIVN